MKLSISIFNPLWVGDGLLVDDAAYDLSSYTHSVSVNGGYESCSFSLGGAVHNAEEWYGRIGGHVEVKAPDGTLIWEGFINSVSIKFGALDLTRGPLLDVANRITVAYSEVSRSYTATNRTVGGEQLYTTPYNDTASQALWGVQEIMLSASSVAPGEADQLGKAYAIDNGVPRISQNVSLSPDASGDVAVSVECIGYVSMLEKYIFSDATSGVATSTIKEKMEDVLAADPNGIFSTDYHGISTNATVVSRYDDTYKTARSAIDELIPLGDSSYNRYIWGVYGGRTVEYKTIPTTIDYVYDLVGNTQKITSLGGGQVDPWSVVPGKFMRVNGLSLSGQANHPRYDNLREAPGMIFIESVSYSAPLGIQLSGGRYDKIEQQIKRLGLGGF